MPVLQIGTEQLLELLKQLEPEERLQVLFKLAEQARDRMEQHRTFAESRLRAIAAGRGLDWDAMSEEERQNLVDDLLHEQ